MKRTVGLLVAGILVIGSIGLAWLSYGHDHDPGPNVRGIFGDEGIEIIRGPDRVEVYRLGGAQSLATTATTETAGERIDGYRVTSRGADLDVEAIRRYGKKLLDGRTYQVNFITDCIFDPHMAWRFVRRKEAVDVLICFHCGQIQITVRDGEEKQLRRSGQSFDEAYANF